MSDDSKQPGPQRPEERSIYQKEIAGKLGRPTTVYLPEAPQRPVSPTTTDPPPPPPEKPKP